MLYTLKKYFGFNSFRPGQEEIIKAILENENVLAVLPTGAGKSLCYQIPSLLSENFAVVISPLIALMKDQVDNLNKKDQIAAFINSSLDFIETENVLNSLSQGKLKLLYVAPERLESKNFAERIKNLAPSYIFVDEAHCISEWGHNFRPSYRKIKEFIEFVQIKNISAFTATATPEVVRDIALQLGMKNAKIFVKGFERENLSINILHTKNKADKSIELLKTFGTPAIIYTSTRKSAEELSEHLLLNKIENAYYHAGLNNIQRKKIQENFISGKNNIIVATNAFGMGIDKKDIRLVIHYNIPGSLENYYQEIGRAGRDGKPSSTFLLFDSADISIQQYFINNSFPDKEMIISVYDAICNQAGIAVGSNYNKEIPINTDYISAYAKKELSRGLISASLKFLQDEGYIKVISELGKKNYVRFLISPESLKKFVKSPGDHFKQALILTLLRIHGGMIFNNKVEVSLHELAAETSLTETEIEEILFSLDNSGIAEYLKPLDKESIMLTKPRADTTRFNINFLRLNDAYFNAQKKLDMIVDFAYSRECRFKVILEYFGEDVTGYKCGKCDNCLSTEQITDNTFEYLQEIILKSIYEFKEGISENNLINILTGKTKSERLKVNSAFGVCSTFTKNDLQRIIHNLISFGQLKSSLAKGRKLLLTNNGKKILSQKNLIPAEEDNYDYEKVLELYHLLKEARSQAALKFNQPKYLICSDELLLAVAQKSPVTKYEMLAIKGFNERMFNKVGNEFLQIISDFNNDKEELFPQEKNNKQERTSSLPQNIAETNNLVKQGYTLHEIAALRNLSEAVVSMQVESIIAAFPATDISKLVETTTFLSVKECYDSGIKQLKDIKEKIGKDISYPKIRIALAKIKSGQI